MGILPVSILDFWSVIILNFREISFTTGRKPQGSCQPQKMSKFPALGLKFRQKTKRKIHHVFLRFACLDAWEKYVIFSYIPSFAPLITLDLLKMFGIKIPKNVPKRWVNMVMNPMVESVKKSQTERTTTLQVEDGLKQNPLELLIVNPY